MSQKIIQNKTYQQKTWENLDLAHYYYIIVYIWKTYILSTLTFQKNSLLRSALLCITGSKVQAKRERKKRNKWKKKRKSYPQSYTMLHYHHGIYTHRMYICTWLIKNKLQINTNIINRLSYHTQIYTINYGHKMTQTHHHRSIVDYYTTLDSRSQFVKCYTVMLI